MVEGAGNIVSGKWWVALSPGRAPTLRLLDTGRATLASTQPYPGYRSNGHATSPERCILPSSR